MSDWWTPGGNDFTIEFYAYTFGAGFHGGIQRIINQWSQATDRAWDISMGTTALGVGPNIGFSWTTDGTTAKSFGLGGVPGSLPSNTWNKIAIQRKGATLTQFLNGIPKATYTIGSDVIANSTRNINIGNYMNGDATGAFSSATSSFYGYIDEVKIYNGALY